MEHLDTDKCHTVVIIGGQHTEPRSNSKTINGIEERHYLALYKLLGFLCSMLNHVSSFLWYVYKCGTWDIICKVRNAVPILLGFVDLCLKQFLTIRQ